MLDIYVVVLNWNRKEDTIECLKSIDKQECSGFKIYPVVVDNASSDNSVNEIKSEKFKHQISFILNESNLGFCEGNNKGITYSIKKGADYVFVVNNDTILAKDTILKLVEFAGSHNDIGVVSPMIYFEKGYEFHKERYKKEQLGKVIWFAGGVIDWKNIYGSNRGVDEYDKGQYDYQDVSDFSTGAGSFFNVKALKKVGLYDEDYYMYFEDVDISQRLRNAGFKVMFYHKAVMWHKVAKSSGIGSDLNDYFITRNRMKFGMKYASLRTKYALFRESLRFLVKGRKWQKIAIKDYYLRKFRKGSWI